MKNTKIFFILFLFLILINSVLAFNFDAEIAPTTITVTPDEVAEFILTITHNSEKEQSFIILAKDESKWYLTLDSHNKYYYYQTTPSFKGTKNFKLTVTPRTDFKPVKQGIYKFPFSVEYILCDDLGTCKYPRERFLKNKEVSIQVNNVNVLKDEEIKNSKEYEVLLSFLYKEDEKPIKNARVRVIKESLLLLEDGSTLVEPEKGAIISEEITDSFGMIKLKRAVPGYYSIRLLDFKNADASFTVNNEDVAKKIYLVKTKPPEQNFEKIAQPRNDDPIIRIQKTYQNQASAILIILIVVLFLGYVIFKDLKRK